MPRQAHGRPLQSGKAVGAAKKRPAKNRRLNALEIAEREIPDHTKIRQHRLGVVDDDSDEPHSRADVDERSSKRRKVDTTQEDDSAEEGSDLEGNRWHVGVEDEDEDSDIDSDEAFGESDEERFADFAFGGSNSAANKHKKPARVSAASLNEHEDNEEVDADDMGSDEDEDDDDLGDDAVDLATAWDMDDEDEVEQSKKKRRRSARGESDVDDEDQSQADSEDGEESDDEQSQLSLSEDEGDHSRLQSFVEGLSGPSTAHSTRKRQDYKNLPEKPSQFGISTSKISAADLMQYIKDPRQRQALKILQNNDDKGNEVYKGGIPGKLAPPLAKRQQDRLDREAAYDETKKELEKWAETVKQNRRAEHLSFPLVDPAAAGALNSKQLGPTSQSQPMNSLESTIQEIMVESGILPQNQGSLDDQEQAYEELLEKRLPLEEVQARRAELRKTRDLMFREEIRARRIKKIKSKAYRRVHRQERAKGELEDRNLLAASGLIDSEEEREKNDRRRAEERMGARHRESKWAKSVKATGRAAWDEDVRHSVTDLARRDEELRRRIEGKAVQNSEDEAESSENDDFSESEDERNILQTKLDQLGQDEEDTAETRLGAMAFMRKAEAARKAANDEEIRNLRRSLREQDDDAATYGSGSEDGSPVGRRRFGSNNKVAVSAPVVTVGKSEFEERESDPEWNGMDDQEEKEPPTPGKAAPRAKKLKNSAPIRSQAALPSQPVHNVSKAQVSSGHPEAPRAASKVGKSSRKVHQVSQTTLADYTSSSGSEDEEDTASALAKAVFAGPDEVEQEFASEKKELEEEEGDQVIDNGLPGWGSWTGEGISKKAQKRAKGRFLTTIKGVAKDKRQDAKLDRVIINEKQVKRNGKYLATELPHPFESQQQYERSLRLPLGPEWTTKTTFQDATKPRVLMKQGVIRPMARPLV